MILEFRLPPSHGKGTHSVDIKTVTLGRVVQATRGERDQVKAIDEFGHIVGFSRIDGKIALEIKWDSSPNTFVERTEYLILL